MIAGRTSSEQVSDRSSPGSALVVGSHEQSVIATGAAIVHTEQQFRRRFDQCRLLHTSIHIRLITKLTGAI